MFFAPDELLYLPLLDKGFDLLFEVIAFGNVMPMVPMEVIVLVFGPLVWITIQFIQPS